MSDEIAYRDLEPGELYQQGDEWMSEIGRWIMYADSLIGTPHTADRRSRRPYNITQMRQQTGEEIKHLAQQLSIARTTAQHWEARTNTAADETAQTILEQLEIAATAFDAIADIGDQSEVGYACGMSAAIAVVRRYAEKAKHAN